MNKTQARAPFSYGWIVIWSTFVALLCAAGIRFSFGALIKPWEADFGWTRDTVSLVGALGLIVYGIMPPLAGRLADQYGARLVLVAGVLLAGFGAIFTSFIWEVWQLAIAFGLIAGTGAAFGSAVPAVPLVSRWFIRRRGLAVGIVTAGTAAAQLVVVPLAIYLIVTVGWRPAMLWIGLTYVVVMAPLVFWLIRSDPKDMGLQPYGSSGDAAATARLTADDDRTTGVINAAKTRPFWMLSLSYFVCGFTSLGLITTHLVPLAVGDLRLTEGNAATALAVLGVFDVTGTIVAGAMSDRFGRIIPLGSAYLTRAVSYVILLNANDPALLVLFGMVYGVTELATVPLTAQLAGDYFGRRSLGTVYGSIFLVHQVGAAIGASYGGFVFRLFGSYQPALYTGIVLLLAATTMSWSLRWYKGMRSAPPKPVAA